MHKGRYMKIRLLVCSLIYLAGSFCYGQNYANGSITASGSTCATAGACVVAQLQQNSGGATITLSGTWSATVQFEAAADGVNFSALSMTPVGGGSAVTSATGNGVWQVNIAGLSVVRARASALASGTAVVNIQGSQASARTSPGGGGSGTVTSVSGAAPVTCVDSTTTPVCSLTNTLNSPGSTTDATSLINTALAGGGTVYLNPGTYALKTAANDILMSVSNSNLICYPGTTIQAQTGFTSSGSEVAVLSVNNVNIQGCIFDGNSLSSFGVGIGGTASNIHIDSNQFMNHTVEGVGGGTNRTGGAIILSNNTFSNEVVGMDDIAGDGGTPSLIAYNNTFSNITGAACEGLASSGDNFFSAYNNSFSGTGGGSCSDGALYGYGVDNISWQHNTFNGVGSAAHCDTCGGGNISDNYAINDGGGVAEYFAEISSNTTVRGNVSINHSSNVGVLLGSGSTAVSPATLRTVLQSFNSNTGITAGTNVTLTSDGSDYQTPSTASMVATASGSFTTGIMWYYNFSIAHSWAPYQTVWVKPTTGNIAAGALELCYSVNNAISTCDLAVPLPELFNNTWLHVIVYATGWQGALSTGFKSVGVKAVVSSASIAVKFDGLQYSAELLGNIATDNKIIQPQNYQPCLSAGALQGGVIRGNYCEGQFQFGDATYHIYNSTNVVFSGNKSNLWTGTASNVVHLNSDATTSANNVFDDNDVSNATTLYSYTSGGTVTGPTVPSVVLPGATSGTAKITPPAVAGTTTNPFVLSNAVQVPCGSTGTPSYLFAGDTGTGVWDFSCGASGALVLASSGSTISFRKHHELEYCNAYEWSIRKIRQPNHGRSWCPCYSWNSRSDWSIDSQFRQRSERAGIYSLRWTLSHSLLCRSERGLRHAW